LDRALKTYLNQRGVRQVKLVISCKVKVLVWVNQWIDFIRFNQPPVSSVARLAERCLWLMATTNVNNSCEAYTEYYIGHRELARS
jgi:hypothetical protein